MTEQKIKIPKPGAGRRVAQRLAKIRQKPISKEILEIVNEISEHGKKNEKRIARPDVEA